MTRAHEPTAPAGAATQPQTFLSFDYGRKRTGVASGNRVLGGATPLTTIAAEGDARFDRIAKLIAEWRPDALVVGVPRHPDGAPHENTAAAQRFGRQLRGRFRLPVFEVDERYSTTAVREAGARDADAAAAALLLEQHFFEHPHETERAAAVARLADASGASALPEESPR
jgi:putative Holliday junction resolvase